jgi:hypothetical protein
MSIDLDVLSTARSLSCRGSLMETRANLKMGYAGAWCGPGAADSS